MAEGVSGFMAFYDKFHRIVLEPYIEIPAKERWIFNNPKILNKVKTGLSGASAGLIKKRGTFSQYIEENNWWYSPSILRNALFVILISSMDKTIIQIPPIKVNPEVGVHIWGVVTNSIHPFWIKPLFSL